MPATQWTSPRIQPPFPLELELKPTKHIPILTFAAATVVQRGVGHYLIDLGREIQGGIVVSHPFKAFERERVPPHTPSFLSFAKRSCILHITSQHTF
jgi:hypothetical protein